MPWACNSSTEALSGMDESQEGGKRKEKCGEKRLEAGSYGGLLALRAGAIYCSRTAQGLWSVTCTS